MPPGIRRMSFVRCMKDMAKAPRSHIWCFTGADRGLIEVGSNRVLKEIGLPVQRYTGKLNPVAIFHLCGELDLVADNGWVLLLDDVKKFPEAGFFENIEEVLGSNYFMVVGQEVESSVQKWITDKNGKIVNCDKIEGRQDLMKVTERIFTDERIQLTSSAITALVGLTGFSIGSLVNSARLLRGYYGSDGGIVELDYNDIVKVVPALNYEDVYAVITEILYLNLPLALDYWYRLEQREGEIQFLFLDRMLSVIRTLWVMNRCGELTTEQQEDLGLDTRTYGRIRQTRATISDSELFGLYELVLEAYYIIQTSSIKSSHVVESLLIYLVKSLRGEKLPDFPSVYLREIVSAGA